MSCWNFEQMLQFCAQPTVFPVLKDSCHALESECLRVDQNGNLSQRPHPKALGSALTNPYIKTDFSEAQLELITPQFTSEQKALLFLRRIRQWVARKLGDERMWPMSAPCRLPDLEKAIPLAHYGSSEEALEKTLYRRGLGHRYGRRMQTLSGIHYNFSFSNSFWEQVVEQFFGKGALQEGKSKGYLHLTRNFLRMGWLNTYLFGATPALDRSYFTEVPPSPLETWGKESYVAPLGTSVRMSEWGYCSKIQKQLKISFNTPEEYMNELAEAIITPSLQFQKIGVFSGAKQLQLNDSLLQIEAEHYARMRPKPFPLEGQTPLESLRQGGIHYVEARVVDVDPLVPDGVNVEQLLFLHCFLFYCFCKESPPILGEGPIEIFTNQNNVALFGRDPSLKLQREDASLTVKQWGCEILHEMQQVALLLDRCHSTNRYSRALLSQQKKIDNSAHTPSAKLLKKLKGKELFSFGNRAAERYHQALISASLPTSKQKLFQKAAETSIVELKKKEMKEDFLLPGYDDLELSTRAVIREALKRGVDVDILDRKQSLIRLRKGEKEEYVQQATKTSKDTYISTLLMENKQVTKQLLEERSLSVPKGAAYTSVAETVAEYPRYSEKMVVVKPNFSNYGEGISFVPPQEERFFTEAVKKAAHYGPEWIVEEFHRGEEHRFLVIAGEVVAVCQRIPAHVVGDGTSSIQKLIRRRNQELRYLKTTGQKIRSGREEKRMLQNQGYTLATVLPLGERAFLRKNSNVSTGGEAYDVSKEVHEGYLSVALRAAEAAGACLCGVDLLIENAKHPPSAENHTILELNFNPALYLHRYPAKGEKRFVEKALLDLLGFS